jgi:hypothetical protein
MRPKLARVRGVSLFLNPVQDLGVGGRQTTGSYQYVLHADNPALLADAGAKLVNALKKQGTTLTDVDIDQQDGGASAYVTVDRAAAARLGVPMNTIDNVLYDAFGQRQVASIYQGLNQYHVVMEASPNFNGKPEALKYIYLPGGASLSTNIISTNTSLGANAAVGSRSAPRSAPCCPCPPWRASARPAPMPRSAIPMASLRPPSASTCRRASAWVRPPDHFGHAGQPASARHGAWRFRRHGQGVPAVDRLDPAADRRGDLHDLHRAGHSV